jgi:hypothetical protein
MVTRFILHFSNHRYWCLLIILSRLVSGFLTETTTSLPPNQQHDKFQRDRVALFASTLPTLNNGKIAASPPLAVDELAVDRRPYEQRTKGPRSARRMNHGFRYLYRTTSNQHENVTAFEYLTQFYTETEVMEMIHLGPNLSIIITMNSWS